MNKLSFITVKAHHPTGGTHKKHDMCFPPQTLSIDNALEIFLEVSSLNKCMIEV